MSTFRFHAGLSQGTIPPAVVERTIMAQTLQVLSASGRLKDLPTALQGDPETIALDDEICKTVMTLLHSYNTRHKLHVGDHGLPSELAELERSGRFKPFQLCPAPSPADYIDHQTWRTDDWAQSDESAWAGHGFYWKYEPGSSRKTNKDPDMSSDFDALEGRFHRLKRAKVLLADHNRLYRDFPSLQGLSAEEIDAWLVRHCGVLSAGQLERVMPGGDQHDALEWSTPLEELLDMSQCTSAVGSRLKGGGRAVTMFIGDQYKIAEDGFLEIDAIDVKGLGTHRDARNTPKQANGFLNLEDALKEYCWEKLITQLTSESPSVGTVQTYAIIDTGFSYKAGTLDPATGYTHGTRCVLLLRQRTSRNSAAYDDPCFYSVLSPKQLASGFGSELRAILLSQGISCEKCPRTLLLERSAESHLEDWNSGEWNIQANGSVSCLVDFSQYYSFSTSFSAFRISDFAVQRGLRLGKFMSDIHKGQEWPASLIPHMYSDLRPSQVEEAMQRWEDERSSLQESLPAHVGVVGKGKPAHSWSWFLEVDDSIVSKYCLKAATDDHALSKLPEQLEMWLEAS